MTITFLVNRTATHLYRLTHCVIIYILIVSCEKPEVTKSETVHTENATFSNWGSGGPYYTSSRNHHYKLTVNRPLDKVDIRLNSSTLNLTYFIYSASRYFSGSDYPDLEFNLTGRKQQQVTIQGQPAGDYYLIVGTESIGDTGGYSLSFDGLDTKPMKIPFQFLESVNQIWSAEGSGGSSFGNFSSENFLSAKNPRYTFTVSEATSWVDIELTTTQEDIIGALFDQQGRRVNTYGGQYVAKSAMGIEYLKSGSYTLIVGSYYPQVTGAFTIRLSGQLSSLRREETPYKVFTDQWQEGPSAQVPYPKKSDKGTHVYQIDIEAVDKILDFTLSTSDAASHMQLFTDRNEYIAGNSGQNRSSIVIKLGKGRYYLSTTTAIGMKNVPYQLSVYGDQGQVKKN